MLSTACNLVPPICLPLMGLVAVRDMGTLDGYWNLAFTMLMAAQMVSIAAPDSEEEQ